MAQMQPGDAAAPADGVGAAVQTVADDAINALHSGGGRNLDHPVGDRLDQRAPPRIGNAPRGTIKESGGSGNELPRLQE